MFKVINNKNYKKEKEKILILTEKIFNNDNNKLANIKDFEKHLDFIFSSPYNNKAFLILLIINQKLVSMINFYEYNSIKHTGVYLHYLQKKAIEKKDTENIHSNMD